MYQPPPRQAYLHQWDIHNSEELPLEGTPAPTQKISAK